MWFVSYVVRVGTVLGVFALIIFALDRASEKQQPPPGPKPYTATPAQEARTAYARPANAPNGTPWPAKAGYVQGLPVLASNGLSEITLDNLQNDSDVFLKLVSLNGPKAFPVRQFFIHAHSQFTLRHV